MEATVVLASLGLLGLFTQLDKHGLGAGAYCEAFLEVAGWAGDMRQSISSRGVFLRVAGRGDGRMSYGRSSCFVCFISCLRRGWWARGWWMVDGYPVLRGLVELMT